VNVSPCRGIGSGAVGVSTHHIIKRASYPHTLLCSFHFMPAVLQASLVSGWAPG
jgi:hypothetical protein